MSMAYEFDPADMLDSYMFPAVARTFAREGFQWATQFAYDPIDMARFNTEYQTHYLNLAYTPQKALGMRIAAHVMQSTPDGADFGKYPADTIFGDVTVSYRRNLALLNTPGEFIHTNNVDVEPVNPDSLRHIAGYGSSPVVTYHGRGAYFLDKTDAGIWRLEVMPDVLFSADPFEKPSLTREVAHIIPASHKIKVTLPDLGPSFSVRRIAGNAQATDAFQTTDSSFTVSPGVYLLSSDKTALDNLDKESMCGNIRLNEFVMPPVTPIPLHVNHHPAKSALQGQPLVIRAEAFGPSQPDSLMIYPSDASFWREENRLYTMHEVAPYTYEAVIPASAIEGKNSFSYRIAAIAPDDNHATFPGSHPGLPLDWDAVEGEFFTIPIIKSGDTVILFDANNGLDGCAVATIPDEWGHNHVQAVKASPVRENALHISTDADSKQIKTVVTRYIGDIIAPVAHSLPLHELVLKTGQVENTPEITISLIDRDGLTHSKTVTLTSDSETTVNLHDFTPAPTLLCPAPYPTFLSREFIPEPSGCHKLKLHDVEKLQLVMSNEPAGKNISAEIIGVWLR